MNDQKWKSLGLLCAVIGVAGCKSNGVNRLLGLENSDKSQPTPAIVTEAGDPATQGIPTIVELNSITEADGGNEGGPTVRVGTDLQMYKFGYILDNTQWNFSGMSWVATFSSKGASNESQSETMNIRVNRCNLEVSTDSKGNRIYSSPLVNVSMQTINGTISGIGALKMDLKNNLALLTFGTADKRRSYTCRFKVEVKPFGA